MTAYEDPTGKLRSIAYPDNHQGYGRIQLDQVIDTKARLFSCRMLLVGLFVCWSVMFFLGWWDGC